MQHTHTVLMIEVKFCTTETVSHLLNCGAVAKFQGLHSRKFAEDDDIPSAPPFHGSAEEIKPAAEKSPASGAYSSVHVKHSSEIKTVPSIKPGDSIGNGKSDHLRYIRFMDYILSMHFNGTLYEFSLEQIN